MGAGDGDVDAPLVVPVIDAAERGDGVDEEEGGVAGGVDGGADFVDAAGAAGAGFVVDDADRADLVGGVFGQRVMDGFDIGAAAPVGFDEDGFEGKAFGHFVPERGEPAGAAHQHSVARGVGVGEGCLPGAGAGGGVDDDMAVGLEDGFEVGEDVLAAFQHLGPLATSAFVPVAGKPGKYLANLPALARLVLASVGVRQVAGGERCTVSEPAEFYSFRRDRVTGRMATMIWIK